MRFISENKFNRQHSSLLVTSLVQTTNQTFPEKKCNCGLSLGNLPINATGRQKLQSSCESLEIVANLKSCSITLVFHNSTVSPFGNCAIVWRIALINKLNRLMAFDCVAFYWATTHCVWKIPQDSFCGFQVVCRWLMVWYDKNVRLGYFTEFQTFFCELWIVGISYNVLENMHCSFEKYFIENHFYSNLSRVCAFYG